MVKLRLKRMGKRHYPVYKIVAADSRFPRDGRFIEALGTYNPNIDPMEVKIKEPRIMYWLKVGAQPTDTVKNLLKNEGVMLKFQLEKKGTDVETIESSVKKFLSEKESKFIVSREKKARRKLAKKSLKNAPKEGEAVKPAEEVAPEVVAETPVEVVKEVVAEVVAETPVEAVKEDVKEVVAETDKPAGE